MGSRLVAKSILSSGRVNMDSKLENTGTMEIEDMDWSFEQEILLLYVLDGHKPVGFHKHFQMLLIREKLSKAMNKPISSKAIWKKLATFYDLEALDESEAEADAANEVTVEFSLPEDEFGELMRNKINGRTVKVEKVEPGEENTLDDNKSKKQLVEVEAEPENSAMEVQEDEEEELESLKVPVKDSKKEVVKRGPKKKEATPTKEGGAIKKDTLKESAKKEMANSKDTLKDSKRGVGRDDKRDETPKKTLQDTKKETREDKKEQGPKVNKRESTDKKLTEQNKKDLEAKKNEQKKVSDTSKPQRESTRPRSETPKQLRTETPKRSEGKPTRAETPKNTPVSTKPNRIDILKKEAGSDKKKELDKKLEKSSEKTPDSVRGAKLRNREKKDESETPVSGTKRERSRDSNSKADAQEETVSKRAKTPVMTKGRPTRNSIEPQPKPASPVVNPNSPQKRRTRMT